MHDQARACTHLSHVCTCGSVCMKECVTACESVCVYVCMCMFVCAHTSTCVHACGTTGKFDNECTKTSTGTKDQNGSSPRHNHSHLPWRMLFSGTRTLLTQWASISATVKAKTSISFANLVVRKCQQVMKWLTTCMATLLTR